MPLLVTEDHGTPVDQCSKQHNQTLNQQEASQKNMINNQDLSLSTSHPNIKNHHEVSRGSHDDASLNSSLSPNFTLKSNPINETQSLPSSNNSVNGRPQSSDHIGNLSSGSLSSQTFMQQQQHTGVIKTEGNRSPLGFNQPTSLQPKRGSKRRMLDDVSDGERHNSLVVHQHYEVNDNVGERSLACPFYKMNKEKYSDCRTHILKRIKDVKQHVYRKHSKPSFYCPLCFQTFDNGSLRDEHIQVVICDSQPDPKYDGITEEQRKRLSQCASRGKSTEDKWYDVWRVIFPNVNPPHSPYLGSYREEMASVIREFWRERKSHIISKTTENRAATDIDHLLLDQVLERLLNQFEAEPSDAEYSSNSASSQQTGKSDMAEFDFTERNTSESDSQVSRPSSSTDLNLMGNNYDGNGGVSGDPRWFDSSDPFPYMDGQDLRSLSSPTDMFSFNMGESLMFSTAGMDMLAGIVPELY